MPSLASIPLPQQSSVIVFFCAVILLWAIGRTTTIRDDDNRRLPRNATAKTFLAFAYIVGYLVLVGAIHQFGSLLNPDKSALVTSLLNYMPLSLVPRTWLTQITAQAPNLAFLVLAGLLYMGPVRDIERRFLIWSHGASHLGPDTHALTQHLQTCRYIPTDAERRRSIDWLKGFDLYFKDGDTRRISLGSVELWRKLNVLLRLTRAWNEGPGRRLNAREMADLDAIRSAHQRKTRLAMDVVALSSRGAGDSTTFAKVSDLLSQASHADRSEVAAVEGAVGALVSDAPAPAAEPLRLAPDELQQALKPINDYFVTEYGLLLEQLSRLTSKSVITAGDDAPARLDELKAEGFQGLGRIQPMDVTGVMRVFLGVGIGGMLLFWGLRYMDMSNWVRMGVDPELARRAGKAMLAFMAGIALVMATAALLGSLFGSRNTHVRAERIPWSYYAGAGALSVASFFLIHFAQLAYFGDGTSLMAQVRQQIAEKQAAQPQRTGQPAAQPRPGEAQPSAARTRQPIPRTHEKLTISRIAPACVFPLFITLGICFLARLRRWPAPQSIRANPVLDARFERVLDAIAMALILLAAGLTVFAINRVLGLQPPRQPGGPSQSIFIVSFAVLGAFIGAVVLRGTRNAAHSHVIARPDEAPTPTPAPLPGGAIAPT